MIEIKEVSSSDEKSEICNAILRTLPSWFGVESAIVDYVNQAKTMPFYAAFDGTKAIGFVALKTHNPFTSEIYVMGIQGEYHQQGMGKKLIQICEQYCKKQDMEFLTVKTLDASRECENYKKTRLFYQAVGFKPLEVFPLHWDEDNPCLFMAKHINTSPN